MKNLSKEEAIEIYNERFEIVPPNYTCSGYSLSAVKTKSGILVLKNYQRNSFVDSTVERKILFRNDGKIFENNKQIGQFID